MLEELKRKLSGKKPDEQFAEMQTQVETLASQVESLQGALNLKSEEVVVAVSNLSKVEIDNKRLQSDYADLVAKYTSLEQESKDYLAKMESEKQTSRKKMLTDVLGDERATATYEAIKSLDDVSFGVVVDNLKASMKTEAKSEMFNETGVAGEDQAVMSGVAETQEAKLLKAKYQPKQ